MGSGLNVAIKHGSVNKNLTKYLPFIPIKKKKEKKKKVCTFHYNFKIVSNQLWNDRNQREGAIIAIYFCDP